MTLHIKRRGLGEVTAHRRVVTGYAPPGT